MLTPAQFVLGNSLIMSNVFSNLPNIKDRMQVEQSCKWFKYVSSGTHYFTSNPLVDSTLTVDVTIDTVKISIADNHFQITFNSNKNIKKQVTDFMEPFLCRVHRQIRRLLLIRNFIHLDDSLEEGLDYLYKLILESAKKLEIIHFDKCNFYSSPHLVTLDETVKSNSAQTIRFTQCEFSESDSECLKIAFSQLDRLTTIQIQPSHCSSSLDFLLLISNTNCRATNISIIENSCHDLRTEDAIEYSQEIVAKCSLLGKSLNFSSICKCSDEDRCLMWSSFTTLYYQDKIRWKQQLQVIDSSSVNFHQNEPLFAYLPGHVKVISLKTN